MTSATSQLVEFAHDLKFEALPAEVVDRLKTATLNILGTALGGSATGPGAVWAGLTDIAGDGSHCVVWGTDRRAAVTTAAFINAQASQVLDFDEGLTGEFMYASHPGAALVPAALNAAEWRHADGRAFLAGLAASYEVSLRTARAIYPGWENLWYVHGKGAAYTLGIAAGAGKLIGLDKKQMLNAFGLGGETAPLPSMSKWMKDIANKPLSWSRNQSGWAAENGIRAAHFASMGAVGGREILEGDAGFYRMVGSSQYEPELVTRGLGTEWAFLSPNYYVKRWPIAYTLASALDGLAELQERHGIRADAVRSVTVGATKRLVSFGFATPTSGDALNAYDAQFSLPHCVACLLAGFPAGPAWASAEAMDNAAVKRLTPLVKMVVDEEAEAEFARNNWYCRAIVEMKDGATYEIAVPNPRGLSSSPLTRAEIEDKFSKLATTVLSKSNAERIIETVARLEKVGDVGNLTRLLALE